jgi:hypothetical protein
MVRVPLGWLYSFLVIRQTSFPIVLYVVASLLSGVVQFLSVVDISSAATDTIIIFVDSENISFEANLAT